MQWFLQKPSRKQALKMLHHKRFRAAYDFLQLRVCVDKQQFQNAYQWWTEIQEKDQQEQSLMINRLSQHNRKKPGKKNKR